MIMNERTEIAAMCLQGLVAHYGVEYEEGHVKKSIELTDDLIAELAKTRPWKVGDRVRIVKKSTHGFELDEIVELKQFNSHYRWFAESKNDSWCISEEEAELVTD